MMSFTHIYMDTEYVDEKSLYMIQNVSELKNRVIILQILFEIGKNWKKGSSVKYVKGFVHGIMVTSIWDKENELSGKHRRYELDVQAIKE